MFLYYFDEHPDYAADSPRAGFGSAHASELPYVFRQLREHNRPPATPGDEAISDLLRTYWTNFAKTGDPNGGGLPKWPAFTNAAPQMLQIKTGATRAIPVVSADGLKVLDDYFAWRRQTSVQTQSHKTITAGRLHRRRLGDVVPASAIGEPVRSVTLSSPTWVEAAWRAGALPRRRSDGAGRYDADGETDQLPRHAAGVVERARRATGWRRHERHRSQSHRRRPGGAPSLLERGFATYGSDSGHQMAFGRGRGGAAAGPTPATTGR